MGEDPVLMSEKAAYHHGDLRTALVQSALGLIEEQGIEALSLREVARRAGVSRTAPYHHFKNKEAMVAAAAAHGFDRLTQELVAVHCDDPRECLMRSGRAYIGFACAHATLYRLMFSAKTGLIDEHPELKAHARCSFDLLMERLQAWIAPRQATPKELVGWSMAVWGAVHGLAELLIDRMGPEEAFEEDHSELWIATLLQLLDGGLRQLRDPEDARGD